jgi:glycerol-1-phosphate dehydrogenase [NAD(P)+]
MAARPRVIAAAPYEMTSAGLGDVIAKPVSTADWRINHRLFGESYSAAIAGIIDAVEPRYLAQPEALNPSANYLRGSAGASPSQSRDHVGQSWEGEAPAEPPGLDPVQGKAAERAKAIEALFEALVFSGCAMTLQGSSLPASGGEHLIGHTLDMLAGVDGIAHDLHGRQVGVATLFVAALYQRAMAVERPVFVPDRVPFNRALWGGIAEAVEVEYRKKIVRTREACARLARPGCWDALRREVTPMLRQPETIKECLRKAGAAHRIADIGCSRERFLMAVMNGAGIRARFTSIDLFFALGLLPDAAEGVVEEWLE